MKKQLSLILILACFSCKQNTGTEIYQTKRDNVTNVRHKIKEIEMEDVLVSSIADVFIINDYFLIADYRASDELIHVFDKKSFTYITSTGSKGQGPDEITMLGHIGIDEPNNRFFATDHGKHTVLCYNVDSLIADTYYIPSVKTRIREKEFPNNYQYISDSFSVACIVLPTGNSGYNLEVAQWNMSTGDIIPMEYKRGLV